MPSLLDPADSSALEMRFSRLRPDTAARWGKFTAPQMLSHAIQSLGMMSGELTMAPAGDSWLLRRWPLKHLLIHFLPFPKGLPTSPELLARESVGTQTPAERWEGEIETIRAALRAVVARGAAGTPWPDHVAMGPMTGRQWGVFQYRHLDHHLRQFGIE
jgi:hypothetical protein